MPSVVYEVPPRQLQSLHLRADLTKALYFESPRKAAEAAARLVKSSVYEGHQNAVWQALEVYDGTSDCVVKVKINKDWTSVYRMIYRHEVK